MKLGACEILAAYRGGCALSKIYLGICEVLGPSGPAALVDDDDNQLTDDSNNALTAD